MGKYGKMMINQRIWGYPTCRQTQNLEFESWSASTSPVPWAIGNFARLDDFFVLFLGIDFAQPIQNRIVAGPADQERCWVAQLEDLFGKVSNLKGVIWCNNIL